MKTMRVTWTWTLMDHPHPKLLIIHSFLGIEHLHAVWVVDAGSFRGVWANNRPRLSEGISIFFSVQQFTPSLPHPGVFNYMKPVWSKPRWATGYCILLSSSGYCFISYGTGYSNKHHRWDWHVCLLKIPTRIAVCLVIRVSSLVGWPGDGSTSSSSYQTTDKA